MPVGLVDAAASGPVPVRSQREVLIGSLLFLQQIMSPEDHQKFKSSFEPTPAKEEVPLAVQLDKTKEKGTVMGRIEHYRNVCRDLETKLMKQSELLDEAVERKATLQDEINNMKTQIATAEVRDPPVPPPGPGPEVPIVLLPPPAYEDEEDD